MTIAKTSEVPLFSKEGLGEICRIWLCHEDKSPSVPLCKGGGIQAKSIKNFNGEPNVILILIWLYKRYGGIR